MRAFSVKNTEKYQKKPASKHDFYLKTLDNYEQIATNDNIFCQKTDKSIRKTTFNIISNQNYTQVSVNDTIFC